MNDFQWLWVCGDATGDAESLTLCKTRHFKIRSSWALSYSRNHFWVYLTLRERVWKAKTASETQLSLPASKAHLCLLWHGLGKCTAKYCPTGTTHYIRVSADLWSCMQLWTLNCPLGEFKNFILIWRNCEKLSLEVQKIICSKITRPRVKIMGW